MIIMERVLTATKKYLGIEGSESIIASLQTALHQVLPFLSANDTRPMPNYDRQEDYDFLFMGKKDSAKQLMYIESKVLFLVVGIVSVVSLFILAFAFSTSVLVIISGLVALFYMFFMIFKLVVVGTALKYPLVDFTKEEIDAITDEELPTYTILVPLREEEEVAHQVVEALQRIDYPEDKLEYILTLEQYDTGSYEALKKAGMPESWNVCWLPDTPQKSKPKAMNVAFLQATGEFSVIYDAEIIPDSDQVKKAYLAFKKHPEIAAFQTRLDHYNYNQNFLTKLFNTEFSFHYDMFLPGLQKFNFPIPLSGHSVHYRTDAIRKIGAWDPFNVAEDCEMGIRLFRYGYRTGIINSFSQEEAVGGVWAWVKQRTRWMKGFIQTSIVHLRYPMSLKRELGSWRDFFAFLILVPGTVLLNLLNFVTAGILLAWFLTGADAIKDMYPMAVLYIANLAAIIGGFTFMYLNLVALYRRERFPLIKYFVLTPFYWFLLSLATARAAWQLRDSKNAHNWEMTVHGTHNDEQK